MASANSWGTKGRESLLATSKTPGPTPGRFASRLKPEYVLVQMMVTPTLSVAIGPVPFDYPRNWD
jgi:hypothetical protein